MSTKQFTLLCQHFYPEMISTGMHMTELAERLSEIGWDITVFCARPSWGVDSEFSEADVPRASVYKGIDIRRVPTLGDQRRNLLARLLFAITFVFSVGWQIWRRRRHINRLVVTTNPPFLGLVSALFSRLLKLPYLLIVYDVYPNIAVNLGVLPARSPITAVWRRITQLILREATTVVVIGRDMADIIRQKLPPSHHDRLLLIPNWSDERRVRPIPRHDNRFRREHHLADAFVVQYAGRMGRTHNLEPLIQAAKLLQDTAVHFQFIGEGAKKEKLQTLVAQAGLQNVHFLPYQPMERLAEMLSAADLAVVCLDRIFTGMSVPSKSYGIMASGTPILGLVDPQSETGQMITELGCGLVLGEHTAVAIAGAIRQLVENPTAVAAMGRAGRAGFMHRYTLAKAAGAYDRAIAALSPSRVDSRVSAVDSRLSS